MRSITVVQAFQYWVKLFALLVPTFVLIAVFLTSHTAQPAISSDVPPVLAHDRTVTVQTPVELQVHTPVTFTAHGTIDHQPANGMVFWYAGQDHTVNKGTTLSFTKGSAVPNVVGAPPTNTLWLRPQDGGLSTLLTTYSLILALFLGTMGLPHVLVRFYTNPNGKAARRTTLHVLLLLGLFYLFPTALGVLSRLYVPQLLVTGQSDAAILLLPTTVLPGPVGEILAAIIVAGAFAAFLSVSSGLIVSIAGVLSTDALPGRVRDFRVAAVIAAAVPTALAIALPPTEVSLSVGMSFALAASTFCPVLLAGVWWPKLTWVGAAAGIVVGGGLVIAALVLNVVSEYTGGWAPWLVVQPALVTVPIAFATVYLVSKATQNRRPPDVSRLLLRMHAPDPLGFIQDRDIARFGATDEQERIIDGRHHRR
jgi:Na+(H+)/acetate symporter ActP